MSLVVERPIVATAPSVSGCVAMAPLPKMTIWSCPRRGAESEPSPTLVTTVFGSSLCALMCRGHRLAALDSERCAPLQQHDGPVVVLRRRLDFFDLLDQLRERGLELLLARLLVEV